MEEKRSVTGIVFYVAPKAFKVTVRILGSGRDTCSSKHVSSSPKKMPLLSCLLRYMETLAPEKLEAAHQKNPTRKVSLERESRREAMS